jgi:hypothetical protein
MKVINSSELYEQKHYDIQHIRAFHQQLSLKITQHEFPDTLFKDQ